MRQCADDLRPTFSIAVLFESRKAPQEVSDDGPQVRRLSARFFVITAAFIVGAAAVMFAIAFDRGAQRRKRESESLSALLGTVYPHRHKNF